MNKFIKKTSLLISLSLIFSCNNINNKFTIKSEPKTSSSSNPLLENKNLARPESKKNDEIIDISNIIKEKLKKQKYRVDIPINTHTKSENVVVIYKNEYFVRVDEKNNKLKENNKVDIVKLTELLEEYKIKKMIDSTTSEDIEELDRRQKINSESIGSDVPHSMSIHYYSFPKESNIIELCKELNKFPFVSTAYIDVGGVLA